MSAGRTNGIGWLAGILGFAAGATMGNQFRPLPQNLRGMAPKKRHIAIAETLTVGGAFALVGAGIGYALTGCDCCPGSTGLGTPITVPVTSPFPPTPADLPQGTPR